MTRVCINPSPTEPSSRSDRLDLLQVSAAVNVVNGTNGPSGIGQLAAVDGIGSFSIEAPIHFTLESVILQPFRRIGFDDVPLGDPIVVTPGATVPEPASLALVAIGGIALLGSRRARRRVAGG